jgi:hypothetical protein
VTEGCAYCGAHVPATVGERIGVVRFCGRSHVVEWFSLPQHDRRHSRQRPVVERRRSA